MMKKLMVFLCAIFLVFGIAGVAGASPVYLNGVLPGSGWTDADGTGDANMCWAAAAANALFFTGWHGGFGDENQILNYFKSHWYDGTGNAYYGAQWFFDGDETDVSGTTGTTYKIDGVGGNFYSNADWVANNGAWNPPPYSAIETWVDRSYLPPSDPSYGGSYGIMARIDIGLGHYINIWGYDTDGDTLYITDNNTVDYKLEMASFSELNLNLLERISENGWDGNYVEPNDNGNGVEPVPEPATLFLLGSGLMGLFGLGRKKFFRR
jgi:hypothetical protein